MVGAAARPLHAVCYAALGCTLTPHISDITRLRTNPPLSPYIQTALQLSNNMIQGAQYSSTSITSHSTSSWCRVVSSDAMARGIDVGAGGVSHVVSYDAPPYITTYVHRAGRTARAGRPGIAVTLLRREEVGRAGVKDTEESGKGRRCGECCLEGLHSLVHYHSWWLQSGLTAGEWRNVVSWRLDRALVRRAIDFNLVKQGRGETEEHMGNRASESIKRRPLPIELTRIPAHVVGRADWRVGGAQVFHFKSILQKAERRGLRELRLKRGVLAPLVPRYQVFPPLRILLRAYYRSPALPFPAHFALSVT